MVSIAAWCYEKEGQHATMDYLVGAARDGIRCICRLAGDQGSG